MMTKDTSAQNSPMKTGQRLESLVSAARKEEPGEKQEPHWRCRKMNSQCALWALHWQTKKRPEESVFPGSPARKEEPSMSGNSNVPTKVGRGRGVEDR